MNFTTWSPAQQREYLQDQLEMADELVAFMSTFTSEPGRRGYQNARARRDRLDRQINNPESLSTCKRCKGVGYTFGSRGTRVRCHHCDGVGKA